MTKITLVGAGSGQFGLGTLGDIFCFASLAGTEICLHDINPTSLGEVHSKAQRFIDEKNLPYKVTASTDRKEALKNADFVVISIEVGNRFELWDMDRTVPQQFGIRQIYGENGGPGGLFHSLRIIPPILDICEDIQKICPTAYIFNYSNPMSRICTTVKRRFPELRFIGLCHEIASLERHLPGMLNVAYADLELTAAGLNHFSVLLKATYRKDGSDAYPDILSKAPAYFETYPCFTDYLAHYQKTGNLIQTEGSRDSVQMKAMREWGERTLFQALFKNFGFLPITTDSHLGEYLGWAYDIADHRAIQDFYTYYKIMLLDGDHEITLKITERIAHIINAIVNDEELIEEAVNIENCNYISELPDFMAVEVPAKINRNGIVGISPGPLPRGFAGLLRNQVAVHDLTAEAVLTKSKKAVIQALLVDPVVDVYRGLEDMVEVMISKQPSYLGYLQ